MLRIFPYRLGRIRSEKRWGNHRAWFETAFSFSKITSFSGHFSRTLLLVGLLTAPFLETRAAQLPAAETIDSPTPAWARSQKVIEDVQRLLADRNTAGLEALADQLRKSRETLDGGTWLLSIFYDNAVVVPDDKFGEDGAMDFYERWANDRPGNITAQICLAEALTSYAWNARGSGWASSVSDEGWRLFNERLTRAWEVLARARKLDEKCPEWYAAAQTVALGQGWIRSDYLAMVDEAIRKEPTFGRYYTNTCWWLLPRWNGQPGDFEKWIANQASTYPPDKRDMQYARFVWMADRMEKREEMVFAPGRLDWDRTKRGFETWLKAMPDNLMVHFEYLGLALVANDRDVVRAQFTATGNKYFPAMWDNDRERFEQARRFAFEGGRNPQQKIAVPSARRQISPEVKNWIVLILRLISGLVGGALAGSLLMTLAIQRQHAKAGGVALLACLITAAALGTAVTLVTGAVLWLYLRRTNNPPPLDRPAPSGWFVLLWLVLLMGLDLGLQFGAGILAGLAMAIDTGSGAFREVVQELARNGTLFQIVANAQWICFLALLVICGPLTREGWKRRLGLFPCRIAPACLWTLLGFGFLMVFGHFWRPFMDGRSRGALELMRLGAQTPQIFFLSVALAAPVVEELIFRGYAYSGWIDKLGFPAAAAATASIFAVCHLQYGWGGMVFIFVFGLVLATLRRRTGSVFPGMAVHILNNLLLAVLMYYQVGKA